MIVFQILLWDIYVYHDFQNVPDEVQVLRYRDNMIARVKEIQRCKNQRSVLVLRTVPAMLFAQRPVALLNRVLKNVSRDMGIGIVDYDAMLWGLDRSMSRDPALFRDWLHPRKEFSAEFASHLMKIGDHVCQRTNRPAIAPEIPPWIS